jgi:hypothetical protein
VPEPPFESSVFINCPLDDEYEPILQAILFCIVYAGLSPRIATERNDSGEARLEKIKGMIEGSKYSIHDLSRCQARKRGEHFRLNMPFVLGIDFGCRQYFGRGREAKKLLILEEKRYRYQQALSDLSGCDIQAHAGDFQQAIRKVRNWLVSEAGVAADGANRILGAYTDFQEWYYEKQLAAGFSEEDIKDYPTAELLEAMKVWVAEGKPI